MDDVSRAPEHLDLEQLRQINHLATSARMVAGLAHELNNALQVVSGLVELLADRTDIPPDALTRIQKIGGQSEKATTAIRQVLTYTREGGHALGTINVATMVEQALALRRYNFGRAGIKTVTEVPPTPLLVTGHDRAVLQILLNLLLNAEEALANQAQRQVGITVGSEGGRVRIAISDNGPGVAEPLRERIFEPFFTTRAGERALGLGLPVARRLAGESGGQVTLADPGPGTTTFVVDWPA